MKYFKKMKESKRKISFIMALALIVSLLPVSPVVEAKAPDITVYVDNQVKGEGKVNVVVQDANPATDGAIVVKVTPEDGTFTGKEDIEINAKYGTGADTLATYSAVSTDSAVKDFVKGTLDFADNAYTCTISNVTGDIVVTVTGTYNPSVNADPTKAPNTAATATASAISDKMLNTLVASEKLTQEEADEVKAGTASLEFKAETETSDIDTETESALNDFIANPANSSIKNIVSQFKEGKYTFVFDLTITLYFVKDGKETEKGKVTDLGDVIDITMEIPEAYRNTNASKLRTYFVIRIHEGVASSIDCTTSGNNFTFKNDKFSKFILCYKDVNKSWNGAGTVTPAPSASAAPGASATPSASATPDASAAPSTDPATPSASATPDNTPGTGGDLTDPGVTNPNEPGEGNGSTSGSGSSSSKVKKGQRYTINGIKYEIISTDSTKTVGFVNGKKNAKKVTIPATVKIKGKKFNVKSIKAGAFKGNKKLTSVTIGANVKIIEKNAFKGCSNLKKIVIKSKKLKAAKVAKNAFKGINKNATVKVPKNKVKAYTKIVKVKGGAGNSVKVTK